MKLKMKNQNLTLNNHSNDPEYAFNRALRYLNLRARSKKELEEYLKRKEFSETAISQAIQKLLELKFLNDEEYGISFMRGRQVYKSKSRYYVTHELRQKGVDSDTISKIIADSQEDLQTATDFIIRKKRIFGNLEKQEFKEKMMRLLSARGFSFDTIKKALEEEK